MKIFSICGSTRKQGSTYAFVEALVEAYSDHDWDIDFNLLDLPLFDPVITSDFDDGVIDFRNRLREADIVLIVTPEYIHNIPAVLKNAFEWVAASGEMVGKKVLAFTYTPNPPRGEKGLESLLFSLGALDAKIAIADQLYSCEMVDENKQIKRKALDFFGEFIS